MLTSGHLTILGLAIIAAAFTSPESSDVAARAATSVRITCFGDSITEGDQSTDPSTRSYPAVLQRLLDDKYGKGAFVVANAGISGQDTRQGLTRVDQVLGREKPDWVLIEYGTNDMWTSRNMTAAETGVNLEKIVDHIRASGARPVLATLTPAYGADQKVVERNEVIRKTAAKKSVFLVDLNAAFEKVLANAGGRANKSAWEKYYAREEEYLHPNDFGYAFLAAQWLTGFDAARAAAAR